MYPQIVGQTMNDLDGKVQLDTTNVTTCLTLPLTLFQVVLYMFFRMLYMVSHDGNHRIQCGDFLDILFETTFAHQLMAP